MIPNTGIEDGKFLELLEQYNTKKYNSFDFKLTPNNTIAGFVDELDALAQAAYLILSTERFQYNTVSHDVGVEFWNLYGDTEPLFIIRLKETVEEALLMDDRVDSVENIEIQHIDKKRNAYRLTCQLISNIGGAIDFEKEVVLDV